jgi:predicted Ser/Thr protein kinase
MDEPTRLEALLKGIQDHHAREGRPMGLDAYLRLALAEPARQLRGAAHYLQDVFDHYGVERVSTPAGERKRFRLFDQPFALGVGRVAGQEEAQEAIYRLLSAFVREGRVNRLILLTGPNGSAKSSIVRAMVQGLEDYSTRPEGALYTFRWVFPSEKLAGGRIGFGDTGALPAAAPAELETFAELTGDALDAVWECELKDHPLLLVPAAERRRFVEELQRAGRLPPDFRPPEVLLRGDLCHQCRRIHDALLGSYGGDARKVLRHVQVVRLVLSGRYQRGVATVEPQMHVDAAERQVTASRGLASLPPPISHLDLYQPQGPLVAANRGLLEYNNMLKRPVDAFKYLLLTCENGQVALDRSSLHLDTVFIGSTNDAQLEAFKQYPDFASFKGRLEVVRVPYLRRVSEEVLIYQDQVPASAQTRHLAPHTLALAARWAVLTRLRRPEPSGETSQELGAAIASLTPQEKAELYDRGAAPARLPSALAQALTRAVPGLWAWPSGVYEGALGASAREVKMVLVQAAQREDHRCVSPLGLFAELAELMKDPSLFAFLQLESEGDYLNQPKLLEALETHYLEALEEEAAAAMGLVSETSYRELFARYMQHVSHWVRQEKLYDPITQQTSAPDEGLMREVESIVRTGGEDEATFRKGLISRVAANALDAERQGGAAQGPPDYARVFPALFERLRDDFVKKRKGAVARALRLTLEHLDGQLQEGKDERLAATMRAAFLGELGYCEHCAKEAMAFLLGRRFQG